MRSLAVASRSFSKHPILRKEVLKLYPDAKFNDEGLSLYGSSLIEFLQGYEKAITALEVIDEKILSKLPDLKVIGKYGVGLDMLDLNAMKKYGIKLGWTGGVNKRSVSELVVSFAIYLLHRVAIANTEVRNGKWYQVKGRQLSDCTVGIIGCGHVGKDLVKLLQPFNCKILVNDILDFKIFHYDLYRLKNDKDIDQLGIFENKNKNITFIEWPELITKKPNDRIEVYFQYSEKNEYRNINVVGFGKWRNYEFLEI